MKSGPQRLDGMEEEKQSVRFRLLRVCGQREEQLEPNERTEAISQRVQILEGPNVNRTAAI